MTDLDAQAVLRYLGLPEDYAPSPLQEPLEFLTLHISVLPRQHLEPFSELLTPRQRTTIRLIKNRRTQYALNSNAPELQWQRGHVLEPFLWESMNLGRPRTAAPGARPGVEAGAEEKKWAEDSFIGFHASTSAPESASGSGASKGYVGRLGELLAEYEEEREADRLRTLRRERAAVAAAEREAEEEFDSDSDEDEDIRSEIAETPEQVRTAFERLLRERFIDGLLSADLYNDVDFEEKWDPDGREDEERWFDDEDES